MMRLERHARKLVTGAALLLVASVAAAPAVAVGLGANAQAAPAPATCTKDALAASTNGAGQQIAGYSVNALAAGFRYELDSPGLLPVGDPEKGNITEMDVPFARENVSEGPLVASLASAAYPGDTAAGLGSALGTFGFNGVPNDPVLAAAAYPPSPDKPASSSYPPGGAAPSAASAGAAHAAAGQDGGSSDASVSSVSLSGSSGPDSGNGGGPASSDSAVHLGGGCIDASATSTTSGITIAGIVHIASVSGTAAARSDGNKAVPEAGLHVGEVTVAGLPAYIDQNGVHLANQQPVGYGVLGGAQSALNHALESAGITVKLLGPVTTDKGSAGEAAATADSGGLDIVVKTTLPATGVPGVPAVSVPGLPPIPLGTPGAPLQYEVVYGKAQVSVDATTAPAPGSVALPGGAAPPGGGTAAPAGAAPGTSADVTGGTILGGSPSSGAVSGPGAGPVGQLAAAGAPPGQPVPTGWIFVGLLASLVVAGPLLGYARWQLLEGRI